MKRIAEEAWSPYWRRNEPVRKWPKALPAPYGVSGATGVVSRCGASRGAPKISAEAALTKRASGRSRRTPSSRAEIEATAAVEVPTGSSHEAGTNEAEARW